MIKGIFFDAAGVLYRRLTPTVDFAINLLKQGNYAENIPELESQALDATRVRASEGQISNDEYWHQYLLSHGVKSAEVRQGMIKQITDYSNDVLPVEGCRETLKELKNRNFILGIVTDTIYPLEWKEKRLQKAGVSEFIDVIACSSVLGVHKPDPAIYLNALEQVDLTPSQSAFVGHDAKELKGAKLAGMLTVAVNYDPGAQADFYYKSIREILQVLEFLHGD